MAVSGSLTIHLYLTQGPQIPFQSTWVLISTGEKSRKRARTITSGKKETKSQHYVLWTQIKLINCFPNDGKAKNDIYTNGGGHGDLFVSYLVYTWFDSRTIVLYGISFSNLIILDLFTPGGKYDRRIEYWNLLVPYFICFWCNMIGDRSCDLPHSKGTMLSRWSNFFDEMARFAGLRIITHYFV